MGFLGIFKGDFGITNLFFQVDYEELGFSGYGKA
jgi:hypothetical protein